MVKQDMPPQVVMEEKIFLLWFFFSGEILHLTIQSVRRITPNRCKI